MRRAVLLAVLGILATGAGAALLVHRLTEPGDGAVAGEGAQSLRILPAAPVEAPPAAPPPASLDPTAPIVIPAGPPPVPGQPAAPVVIQGPPAIPLSADPDERAEQLADVRRARLRSSMDALNRRAAERLQRPAPPPRPAR